MANGFYVHMSDRTNEQETITSRTYEAAKLLNKYGFECEVVEYFCSDSKDCPAGIRLKS